MSFYFHNSYSYFLSITASQWGERGQLWICVNASMYASLVSLRYLLSIIFWNCINHKITSFKDWDLIGNKLTLLNNDADVVEMNCDIKCLTCTCWQTFLTGDELYPVSTWIQSGSWGWFQHLWLFIAQFYYEGSQKHLVEFNNYLNLKARIIYTDQHNIRLVIYSFI